MVGIYKSEGYVVENLENVVDRIFNDFNIQDKIKEKMNVVIKPDLNYIVEENIPFSVTSVLLIKTVAKKVMKLGANVTIADTVDGIFNEENLKELYKKLGLDELIQLNINLNNDVKLRPVKLQFGKNEISINIIDSIKKADFVINMPKIKTNSSLGISGAINNMLNALDMPSIRELYKRFPKYDEISKIAKMITASFKNQFTIADAILCMEKDGPINGSKTNLNCIIASDKFDELDFTVCEKFFKSPQMLPIYCTILEDSKEDVKNIVINKDEGYKYTFMTPTKNFQSLGIIDKIEGKDIWPNIDVKKCIKCKICALRCPMDVIHEENHIVVMRDRYKCTKCMYCTMKCPVRAINLSNMKVKKIKNVKVEK